MERRYVEELSKEELVKVFHANAGLRSEITDDMYESEMMWVNEKLEYIRSSARDWSIGAYGYNYITVNNSGDFVEGLVKMDKEVPLFGDEEAKQIYKVKELKDQVWEKDQCDDDFDELEEEFEEAVKELAEAVAGQLKKDLEGCYNEEYMLDYFLDFYLDARIEKGTLYIEDDDYTLCEDISYTKRYN